MSSREWQEEKVEEAFKEGERERREKKDSKGVEGKERMEEESLFFSSRGRHTEGDGSTDVCTGDLLRG